MMQPKKDIGDTEDYGTMISPIIDQTRNYILKEKILEEDYG